MFPRWQPNPAYNFSFDVKDDTFTNYQNRKEQREGDKITGSYSVVDSDGFIRTVTYTADPLQGFKCSFFLWSRRVKIEKDSTVGAS
ncbi:hypothetical protein J437_LFUL014568 [Ladona fulva]|uniref:Cuticle protein n=1 Tax=Ladona fulva TaxID=123851 RepID=A0A8K0P5T2_LADFU|nr:hypothetical protein J437_LFUL014568 [Ladona fulva]